MAITLTRHNLGQRDYYGEQLGDRIAVADGAVSPPLTGGLYRIVASTNSIVRIGNGLTNASGGASWPAGTIEPRRIEHGAVIACDAG
jgi:hypothetical protein